jgi:hypothetical protein
LTAQGIQRPSVCADLPRWPLVESAIDRKRPMTTDRPCAEPDSRTPPARVAWLAAAWLALMLASLVGATLFAPWAAELCRRP